MTSSRMLVLPVTLALAAGFVAGCGGSADQGEGSGSSTASASSSASSKSSSEAAAAGTKVQGAKLATDMRSALEKAGTFKSAVDSNLFTAAMDNVIRDGKSSAKAQMSIGGITMEIVLIDDGAEAYIKAPGVNVPTWTKVEESSSNPAVASMAKQLSTMSDQLNPAKGIEMFGKAGDFTSAGPADVNGVQTVKYTGTIPGSALAPAGEAAGASGTPVADMPVELYLDKDNRPIKTVQSVDGGGTPITVSSTYSEFGGPITVTAPQVGS